MSIRQTRPRRLILLCTVSLSAFGFTGNAFAAQGVRPLPVNGASSDQAAVASSGNAASVDDIVVTAQKKTERMLEVPSSVGAIEGERLEKLNVRSIVDYAAYIPGFNVTGNGAPGRTGVALRGIASIGPGAVVGTMIDETPMGSSGGYAQQNNTILDLMPYDLQRVEVLRGPQGTLYGAGAMGGVLKYVLTSPKLEGYSGKVGASVSTIDGAAKLGWGLRGLANIPLIPGKLALLASAYGERTPGYLDNLGYVNAAGVATNPPQKDSNKNSQWGGRAVLLWQPTDALSVELGGLWQRARAADLGNVALRNVTFTTDASGAKFYTGEPTLGTLVRATGALEPFTKDIDLYTATVKADVGFGNFVSATGYSRVKTINSIDNTYTLGARYPTLSGNIVPAGVALLTNYFSLKKFTQEFRLSSSASRRVEWLLGAFYTYEDSDFTSLAPATTFAGAPISYFGAGTIAANTPTSYKELSGFANLTVHLTDNFKIAAGGRYSGNWQDYKQFNNGVVSGFSSIANKFNEKVFTWLVNPSYNLTPNSMVYARVATGYRPGGANAPIPTVPTAATYDSDTLINYEVGYKGEFFNRRASLDISAFYIDWSNIQVTVFVVDSLGITRAFLSNAGKAISKGIEFQGVVIPIDGLRLGVNGAYTNAYIDSVPQRAVANGFVLGAQLPNVAKFSGSATADYSFELANDWQASLGAGVRRVGSKYNFTITTSALNIRRPGYTAVDLNAGLTKDKWAVRAFVRNLTNKYAFVGGNPLVTGAILQLQQTIMQPRTIGLEINRSF